MSLTAGIVGLPNVGKSTLFNAITKNNVLQANYPFATIDPNVGVVEVPDERLNNIASIVKPQKLVPTTFEFTDIAGLVKGASKGEGLGNQFLSHIKGCDAICQVVRCFENTNIIHVDGSVDPIRDVQTINLELILSDLEIVEKRIPKIEKKALLKQEGLDEEYRILKIIQKTLLDEMPIRSVTFNETDLKFIKNYSFLTIKPLLYIANVSEEDLVELDNCKLYNLLKIEAQKTNSPVIPICAQIEQELSSLSVEEKNEFLIDLGLKVSGLDELIQKSYEVLGLKTYFTAGEKEVRAWTFLNGMTAPECAGIIHTDFQKGFIKAETVSYLDFVEYKSLLKAKEKGKVRLEGKDYIVQDGDIMNFRFNV